MTRKTEEKTFIRITNQDIYNKLEDVHEHLVRLNGTVKSNRDKINWIWASVGSLTAGTVSAVLWLISNFH